MKKPSLIQFDYLKSQILKHNLQSGEIIVSVCCFAPGNGLFSVARRADKP